MYYVILRFELDGIPHAFHAPKSITFQDYVFNGAMRPEKAIVVDGTAYELSLVAAITITVHKS